MTSRLLRAALMPLLPLALLVLGLAACTGTGTEGVRITPAAEYKSERLSQARQPVILIPGTLGSRLFNMDNGEIAWGNFSATVSDLKDDLALPIDHARIADNVDRLRAYRVLDRAEILLNEGRGEVSFYAEIIDHLATTLGYRPAYGKRFYRGQDLFVFFYDWRRSNVEAAAQLADFIASIRHDLDAPDMKFTFVGVSNGGLIARYYLRYGARDVVSDQAAGAPMVRSMTGLSDCSRLICLGTPQLGTLDALNLIHDGYSPNLLARRYPPETIFSMPAAFELLPEPGQKVFVGRGGETLDIDLWDERAWETYGLSVFAQSEQDRLKNNIALNADKGDDRRAIFETLMQQRRDYLRRVLAHARRFRAAIEGPPEVPTDVMLGVRTPTLARVGLVQDGDEWQLLFRPRVPWGRYDPMAEAMFAAGDGIVTRRSGLGLPIAQSSADLIAAGQTFRRAIRTVQFTPFEHRTMFEDEVLRLALAEALSEP